MAFPSAQARFGCGPAEQEGSEGHFDLFNVTPQQAPSPSWEEWPSWCTNTSFEGDFVVRTGAPLHVESPAEVQGAGL